MRIPTLTLLGSLAIPLLAPQFGAGVARAASTARPATSTVEVRHPEDLFIVDCLLPSRVRNLGRHAKFAAPRQVVRSTAHECGLRGGEFTLDPTRNDFALQAWMAQAEGGDAEAANNVGEIYEQGVRGEPDLVQAAVWYRKAADGGSRRAQRNLAHCYESGSGVAKDAVQAIVWYRKAAGLAGATDLDLEKEVAALRSEVSRLTGEAASARAELELNATELARAREALVAAERDLAQAKTSIAAISASAAGAAGTQTTAAPDAGKTPAGPGGASTKPTPTTPGVTVAQRQQAVESGRKRVADLEAAQDRYRRLASELESSAAAAKDLAARGREAVIAKRAPAIEFLRPDVLATRGPALVPVPAGAREVEIVGKVTAELGLVEFTAAGERHEIGADGLFRVRLPVEANKTIPFVAVDRAARRTEAELVFVASGAAAPAAASLAGAPRETGRRFHALVLAGGAYRNLAPLATAIADGEDLAAMLRDRFGFEVDLLPDATFLSAMQRLTELAGRLGPKDDLLVYFAGHGRIDEATGRGYWLPVDADPNDRSTWIPNEALAKIFGIMRAGRVLVVADSCYAGALGGLGLERAKGTSGADSRVRSVLSSGGLAPVLDEGAERHSIFARALLTVLSLAREPLSADRLYQAVSARVAFRSSELGVVQRPEYAQIGFAGHEGGDFIFQPKS
ncbi:MAG: SEL1-like repeat protein [Thermoanaerobaculia bacterium]|nr:SEL1-like repeat protein [Thermoanaerobaculia bacterium]MBP9822882.1 SEL1-like repeat protein [Thermoanaerobaculia bacterium]